MISPGRGRQVRFLSRSRFFVAVLLILQIAFIIALLLGSTLYFRYASIVLQILNVIICVHILNKTGKNAYKLIWLFLILLVPVFGGCFYLLFYIQSNPRRYRRLISKYTEYCRPFFRLSGNKLSLLQDKPYYSLCRYLQDFANYPVYANTAVEYFPSGESYFARLVEELAKAERYIFIESFIIRSGTMFDAIFRILEDKARSGLDVRVLYDDLGCFAALPADFSRKLEEAGIRCLVFNPFRPVLSSLQNNRDHRKIISIDGRAAFTGGVNIGDEYINIYEKYGVWKDSAVMISGDGAWSLTMIFLRLWNIESALRKIGGKDNFAAYFPRTSDAAAAPGEGFVQPYAESPITKLYICENVYIHVINMARQYLYINTPYLVPDENLYSALILAAQSGIDIRIITPHIPDKPFVHLVTRSYYRLLIKAGVRIYEYTRGFNHSKTFVCDDIAATVGTTNLDFRSLCLHYECGVFIADNNQVLSIKEDFLRTLEDCKEFTEKDLARGVAGAFVQDLLRIFAPIM